MLSGQPDLLLLLVIAVAVGFVPLVALVATSYLKIVVVLGLVRNAMGVQQVPPGMVLSAIALVLSVFVMGPVAQAAAERIKEDRAIDLRRLDANAAARLADHVQQPLAAFLQRHTTPADREFFVSAAAELWAGTEAEPPGSESLLVLVPAFTLRELTRAFQIGFVLYLAFIAVDLIVANVIQALGLSMVSPTPVAIPFKLLLFVAFDGWQRLVHALVLSYR